MKGPFQAPLDFSYFWIHTLHKGCLTYRIDQLAPFAIMIFCGQTEVRTTGRFFFLILLKEEREIITATLMLKDL